MHISTQSEILKFFHLHKIQPQWRRKEEDRLLKGHFARYWLLSSPGLTAPLATFLAQSETLVKCQKISKTVEK